MDTMFISIRPGFGPNECSNLADKLSSVGEITEIYHMLALLTSGSPSEGLFLKLEYTDEEQRIASENRVSQICDENGAQILSRQMPMRKYK